MKIGILGTWHVHAPGYTDFAKNFSEVVSVYDPDTDRLSAFAKQFGLTCYSDRDEFLASGIDAVIVCSATNSHKDDILAAINAGKAIFTEKILALTTADCLEIKQALDAKKVPFVISFPHKFTQTTLTAKQIVDNGELGKLNYIRFRNCHSGSSANWLPTHFYNLKECGGGAMIDLGAHGMYLIDMFKGLPSTYASAFKLCCEREDVALKNTDRVEDNAITVMSYADGCIAVNETGFVSVGSPVTLEIGGEKGYISVVDNKVTKATAENGHTPTEVALADSLPSPLEQFLTGNILTGCGIDEAIHLTQMMEGAYKNA